MRSAAEQREAVQGAVMRSAAMQSAATQRAAMQSTATQRAAKQSRSGAAHVNLGDRMGSLAAAVLLATMLAGCGNGPVLVFPGGAISGDIKPDPESWAFAGDSGMIELETQAEAPYSVNVAYTIMDDRLYVNAGDTKSEWVKRMESNRQVRILMGDDIYELRAMRVTDRDIIERFGAAWEAQSFFRRNPAELEGEVWIFELETN